MLFYKRPWKNTSPSPGTSAPAGNLWGDPAEGLGPTLFPLRWPSQLRGTESSVRQPGRSEPTFSFYGFEHQSGLCPACLVFFSPLQVKWAWLGSSRKLLHLSSGSFFFHNLFIWRSKCTEIFSWVQYKVHIKCGYENIIANPSFFIPTITTVTEQM